MLHSVSKILLRCAIAAARSAVKAGRGELASECYGTLQGFLSEADPDVAFLKEVREFEPVPATGTAVARTEDP